MILRPVPAWIRISAVILGIQGLGVDELAAQGGRGADRVTYTGHLVVGESEEPAGGVFLEIGELGLSTISNGDGIFRFDLPPGTYLLRGSHVAYHDLVTAVTAVEGEATAEVTFPLQFRAIPLNPIMVEVTPALAVLENRRKRYAEYRTKAFEYDEIQDRITTDIVKSLAPYAGVPVVPCTPYDTDNNCWVFRGRDTKEICVYLDEGLLFGGLVAFQPFPTQELGRIEFFPASGVVKAYSRAFLSRATDNPRLILPVLDLDCPRSGLR